MKLIFEAKIRATESNRLKVEHREAKCWRERKKNNSKKDRASTNIM